MRVLATVETDGFVRQLREFERKVRKQVCKKAATKGAQEYVKVAKTIIPVRDTKQALKSAGVRIAKGVQRKEGGASYTQYSDKRGRVVKVSYRGGLLKKSQGYKMKSYRGEVAVAICGTRSGFRQRIGTRLRDGNSRGGDARNPKRTRKLAKAGDAIYADPVKYAHLVDRGTKRTKPYAFDAKGRNAAKKTTMEVAAEETLKAAQEASKS